MPLLTIFTATYNRAHLIEKLYRSLQRQRNFDFEWLVVDDGSEDNTEELFEKWKGENNPFLIRYYKQENKGLIRALNRGIELAEGDFFAKIDSDDYVVDEFVNNMVTWINGIREAIDVYGVAGVKVTEEGVPLKGIWPSIKKGEYVEATDLERKNYNLDADMCEAWKTDELRRYPFPVWEGEKFAPEQIVFFHIAHKGLKIRWYPVAMLVVEYQEGGLTHGASKLERENPMGYAMMYNQRLEYLKSFTEKCKTAMQCNALSIIGGHPEYILQSNSLVCSCIMILPGMLLSIRRKRQYKEEK